MDRTGMTDKSEAIIKAEGICRQFTRKRGDSNVFFPVKETDFVLRRGETAVLSGASGSGKTTFLNMLAGILKPTKGEILLAGRDICKMPDEELSLFRNGNIGIIPQGRTAIDSLTALENVLLPWTMYGRGGEILRQKKELAIELFEKLKIIELQNIMPSELSGGELRRVAVARALIMNPEVILADEPTSDLDDENGELVLKLLKDLSRKGNKGLLIVTHDRETNEFADTAYRMTDGILKREG